MLNRSRLLQPVFGLGICEDVDAHVVEQHLHFVAATCQGDEGRFCRRFEPVPDLCGVERAGGQDVDVLAAAVPQVDGDGCAAHQDAAGAGGDATGFGPRGTQSGVENVLPGVDVSHGAPR